MTPEKKQITVNLHDLYMSGYRIETLVSELRELERNYTKQGYTNFTVNKIARQYDEGYDWYFSGERLENDEEFKIRVAKDEEFAARQEEYARQQYENLKKKFEP